MRLYHVAALRVCRRPTRGDMRVLRSSTSFFHFLSFTPFIHVACYVRDHIVLCAFTRICALASHAIAPERLERFVIQLCKRGGPRERIESNRASCRKQIKTARYRCSRITRDKLAADNALQLFVAHY